MALTTEKPLSGRKLMCIVAHPDDECYAFGGALALAAADGAETYVICLTDGQAATHRGDAASAAALGQMRRDEFAASCNVLGVTRHELLDYQDAQLEFADFSRTARLLVERIRAFQPDIVLTFALDGGLNTHPDHAMVSAFASTAFHWSASAKRFPDAGPIFTPKRLFHVSTNYFLPERPAPLPPPYNVVLDIRSVFDTKLEAFRRHASQAPLMEKTKAIFAEHGHNEYYTLAAAINPQPATRLTSLFEGL